MSKAFKKTQKEAVMEYVEFNGSIIPAKMIGRTWNGLFFGPEITRRCRELRQAGFFASERDGRFEKFNKVKPLYIPQVEAQAEPSRLFELSKITSI